MRKIFFALYMLLPFALQAQFVDIDWSSSKGDSLLPVCSSVVELPADYASYSYSAQVEYPEYFRMTSEEIARYSLKEKYPSLPGHPVAECHVGIQAKQPQLDVSFLPVIMRDGVYYRIGSYKLAISRVSAPAKARNVVRTAVERYAPNSVLASGKWVRISVKENGVHKITDKELKEMGFRNPSKVALYGYGGHILPETDIAGLIDDLCEVPLWRENGYVLFYANGVLNWNYTAGRYLRSQNVYSEYGCYFLTEVETPMEFPVETMSSTSEREYTTFKDYVLYENDAKSLCSYGRELVDDYDYSYGRTMRYKLPVTGVVQQEGILEVSFATNGIERSIVSVKIGESNVGTLAVGTTV